MTHLTKETRKLVTYKGNVAQAAPLWNFMRNQRRMAKIYKEGKYKSETVA